MIRIDPTSLNLFLTIIEEGTIAAAAAREHITAAAVSKRISEIESTLGTHLLTRTNKGVEPTAAGIALVALAKRVLNVLDDISVKMQDYSGGVRGLVKIASDISAITQFLPEEIKSFLAEYPDVEIQVEEKTSSAVGETVSKNSADIGIIIKGTPVNNLQLFPYHSDRLVLILPKDHALAGRTALSIKDTLDFEYVGLQAGSAINQQICNTASELNRPIKLRMLATSFDGLCCMVNSGLGIGILPEDVARHFTHYFQIQAIPLAEPWAHRDLKICVRSYQSLPVAAQMLVTHLQKAPREAPRAVNVSMIRRVA
jgi:DNA-binding transcriptional LysR family regulator